MRNAVHKILIRKPQGNTTHGANSSIDVKGNLTFISENYGVERMGWTELILAVVKTVMNCGAPLVKDTSQPVAWLQTVKVK